MDTSFHLIARIGGYGLVQSSTEAVRNYYAYVKQQNSYVKSSLEAAESALTYAEATAATAITYAEAHDKLSQRLTGLLVAVDSYGCKQLDKIEHGSAQLQDTLASVKPKINTVANKIHGTPVETVLLKAVSVADSVVDSLFPAEVKETEDPAIPEDANIVARTEPVLSKLRSRVSVTSVKRLPSRSYRLSRDFLLRVEDAVPLVKHCIEVLTLASTKLQEASSKSSAVAKQGLHKGTPISKERAEYMYRSLHKLVGLVGTLTQLIVHLDHVEVKSSVNELAAMIRASKIHAGHLISDHLSSAKLKNDISAILQKTGDHLSSTIGAGYAKVQQSDNTTVRKTVEAIEALAVGIMDRFNSQPNSDESVGSSSDSGSYSEDPFTEAPYTPPSSEHDQATFESGASSSGPTSSSPTPSGAPMSSETTPADTEPAPAEQHDGDDDVYVEHGNDDVDMEHGNDVHEHEEFEQ